MLLDISKVATKPSILTKEIDLPNGEIGIFRPLEASDVEMLEKFFKELSSQTKEFYMVDDYDMSAKEYCENIAKYDKLRMILTDKAGKEIIVLMEYSFDITEGDGERFTVYGLRLTSETDCRFGPVVADEYQGQGIAALLFPEVVDIAKQFGQKRMILWGGVFPENKQAIRFYEKVGFKRVGKFVNKEGRECLDMVLEMSID